MPTKKKAKKKAVKKAVTKKKVAKKKGGQAKTPSVAPKTIHVYFGCVGGFCVPDQDPLNMNPLDTVVMHATTSDIRVTFTGGSPFSPSTNPINIPKGGTDTKTVVFVSLPPKKFRYRLRCRNDDCPTPAGDPSMIID
jgi:hypothetical protein